MLQLVCPTRSGVCKVLAANSLYPQQIIAANDLQPLPLMHSCECFSCREIIRTKRLEARMCPVFGENLLYFFYGKAVYPVAAKVTGFHTDFEYCPVCFIVPIEKVTIHKVFPFDSGGYKTGLFSEFIDNSTSIDEFQLPNTVTGIQDYIKTFFGNNENYINGEANLGQLDLNACQHSLLKLLNANGIFRFDERAVTIEVISQNSIALLGNVECVIVPQNLLRDDNIMNYFKACNIQYLSYNVRKLTSPSRYDEVVLQKALEYLKTRWKR